MLRIIGKIVGILTALDVVLFLSMIAINMTDEKPPVIGRYIYWTLKYVFGFPIVLVNNNYPFFLDDREISLFALLLIIVNNMILALIIVGIKRFLINNIFPFF